MMLEELEDKYLELVVERGFLVGLVALVCSLFLIGIGGMAEGMHGPSGGASVGVIVLFGAAVISLAAFVCAIVLWHRTGEASIWVWWDGALLITAAILLVS